MTEETFRVVAQIQQFARIAADEKSFMAFLSTIEDREAIEEFFNRCHDENGRFCGGGTAERGVPGKNRGPGTRRPAIIDYYKQRINTKREVFRRRQESKAIRKITVGPVLGGLTNAVYGNVKVKKLAKTDLTKLNDADLRAINSRLKSDQRFYNHFTERSVVWGSPVLTATSAVVSNWKTQNIPKQIERVEKEQIARVFRSARSRGLKLPKSVLDSLSEDTTELVIDFDSLVAAGDEKPLKLTAADIDLIAEFLERLEDDDDVSAADKKKILSSFE